MDSKIIEKTMLDYFKLKGKTAIVTGAGNGMGRGIAKMFAGLGVNVVGCDIERDSVEKVAKEVTEEGGTMLGLYCDIRKYEDIQAVIGTTMKMFGTVDILVNNAACPGGEVPIEEMTEERWMNLIDVDLNAVFRFTTSVLPIMQKRKSGKIVNISSGAGITGGLGSNVHYPTAKGGVIAFTKALARQVVKDKINVNCIAPGLTDTRMANVEEEIIYSLWYRAGTPWDIACSTVFLASAASDYYTGQVICPNGGEWM